MKLYNKLFFLAAPESAEDATQQAKKLLKLGVII
jgi:hypothetical protein